MRKAFILLVGMAGFEPATSSTPCWRDTWLRYIPKETANLVIYWIKAKIWNVLNLHFIGNLNIIVCKILSLSTTQKLIQ